MTDCFLGEVRIFGGNYAPENWHLCDGTLLSVQAYPGLYSLLGTAYGGDAVTTFGLPNFKGRAVLCQGQAPGSTTNYLLGQVGGTETVALTEADNPVHSHAFNAVNIPASTSSPVSTMLAAPTANGSTTGLYINQATVGTAQVADVNFLDYAGGAASGGGSQTAGNPHENMMPFQTLNYIICISNGLYPDRP